MHNDRKIESRWLDTVDLRKRLSLVFGYDDPKRAVPLWRARTVPLWRVRNVA
jgi:hypothetical protein